jgi:hypothetical protein
MKDSCQRFKSMVSDYIEGELDRQNQAQMEKHLRDCLGCKSKISQLKQLIQNLKTLPKRAVSPDFETILRARINRESRLARRQANGWLPIGQFRVPAYVFGAAVIILALFAVFALSNRMSAPMAERNDRWMSGDDQRVEPILNERYIYIIETQSIDNIVPQTNNPSSQSRDNNVIPDSSQASIENNSWRGTVQTVDSRVY